MENTLPILIADDSRGVVRIVRRQFTRTFAPHFAATRVSTRVCFCRTAAEIVGAEVAKRSWAREQVVVHVVSRATGPLTPATGFGTGPV